MKREELVKLGLAEEVVDKVMAMNGQDIEKHKNEAAAAKTEVDGFKTQLAEASKQIEAFKGMDIEGVKKSADEWKTKAEKAESDSKAALAQVKFDHALENALAGAKAKNPKAVKALLDLDVLKKAYLKPVKEANDYLFDGQTTDPKIVVGGQNKTILSDAVVAKAREAAGLPVNK